MQWYHYVRRRLILAELASFGDIVFEVSDDKVLTYDQFTRTTESRWVNHKILYDKPDLEFEGAGTDSISLRVLLRAELGVNPEEQMAKIREFARRGKKAFFIRGNKPISVNYWVINKAVETHKTIDQHGNVLTMEVELNLLEYPKKDEAASTKKTVSSVKKETQSNKKVKGTISIKVKSVHIRSGPGVNNKVLGYAMKNDKLTVLSEKNGWYSLGGGKYIAANPEYSTFKGAK